MSSPSKAVDAEIITRDCYYGFSGHAVLADGTRTAYTTRLHPVREEAEAEVRAALQANCGEAGT